MPIHLHSSVGARLCSTVMPLIELKTKEGDFAYILCVKCGVALNTSGKKLLEVFKTSCRASNPDFPVSSVTKMEMLDSITPKTIKAAFDKLENDSDSAEYLGVDVAYLAKRVINDSEVTSLLAIRLHYTYLKQKEGEKFKKNFKILEECIKRRWQYTQVEIPLAMGVCHPRLGSNSLLRHLDPAIMQRICHYAYTTK